MKTSEVKILIVDDSALIQSKLISIVDDISFTNIIGVTGDANEALQLVTRYSPDVVLLDIQIKGGNGLDVLQFIMQSYPQTTVVIVTNFPYPQYRMRCKKEGAKYFLDKSKELHRLEEIVYEIYHQQVCAAPNIS